MNSSKFSEKQRVFLTNFKRYLFYSLISFKARQSFKIRYKEVSTPYNFNREENDQLFTVNYSIGCQLDIVNI